MTDSDPEKGSVTSDDSLLKELALGYSKKHPTMHLGKGCSELAAGFQNGIVNGAQWKEIHYTMQDYAYLSLGAPQLSFFISCCKYPSTRELDTIWDTNREPLLEFLSKAHQAVQGVIHTLDHHPLNSTIVTIKDSKSVITLKQNGPNFYRLLAKGQYKITAQALGYSSVTKEVTVNDNTVTDVMFNLHEKPRFTHHKYAAVEAFMRGISSKCSSITRLYSIGQTVQYRNIWVMEISDKPGVHEAGEPEFSYVGGIHGNEAVGKEMLLLMIQHLCLSYGKDDLVTRLVNSTRIHILPVLNSDGAELASEGDCLSNKGRNNARDVDINSNFPGMYTVRLRKCRIVCDCELPWFFNSLNSANLLCVFSKSIVFIHLRHLAFVLQGCTTLHGKLMKPKQTP